MLHSLSVFQLRAGERKGNEHNTRVLRGGIWEEFVTGVLVEKHSGTWECRAHERDENA